MEPIYARPGHPQTKGKLERWFGTVAQMFVPEAQLVVEKNPAMTVADFNRLFLEWLTWYNNEKPHKELPHRSPPGSEYFVAGRIHRPLQCSVDWDFWIATSQGWKVTKVNEVSYKGARYALPPGHAGCKVEIRERDGRIEVRYKGDLLATHVSAPAELAGLKAPKTRRVAKSGTIWYRGAHYTVGYRLGGKTVTVRETSAGTLLLVYLDGVLTREISLK